MGKISRLTKEISRHTEGTEESTDEMVREREEYGPGEGNVVA
jgi:hypothetical protein